MPVKQYEHTDVNINIVSKMFEFDSDMCQIFKSVLGTKVLSLTKHRKLHEIHKSAEETQIAKQDL